MFPSLIPAIAMLTPNAPATVTYSLWVPADGLPGEGEGAWTAPAVLPEPASVSVPSGTARTITSGGEVITVDLLVFCPGKVFPPDITPQTTRAPRVFYEGLRYRVIKVSDYGSVSDHQEAYVVRDLGREPS